MTARSSVRLCLAVFAAGNVACASTELKVARVNATATNVQGIRYSLPKPFLVVKPSAAGDGTFTVELVYLPNQDETYAISGKTKRGKYTLEVETKDGLLKKIGWHSEAAAVDSAAITSAQELAKATIEERAADQKKAEEERLAEQKAARSAVKEQEAAVEDKALALKLAELDLASAKAAVARPGAETPAEKAAIRQAELNRDKAAAELLDAQTRLAQRRSGVAGASNEPSGTASTKPSFEGFWGPVIYEIRDRGEAVDLVPVKWSVELGPQIRLETATAKPPVAAAGGTTPTAAGGTLSGVSRAAGAVVITLSATKPVKTIDVNQVTLINAATGVATSETPKADLADGGKQIRLTFRKLAVGTYNLFVEGIHEDGGRFSVTDLQVTIQ